MINNTPKFSVSMSVYKNDDPHHFKQAIHSLIYQTIVPDEIIIVLDGPVPKAIEEVLEEYCVIAKQVKVIKLKENMGHGFARNIGLKSSKYSYVALMDSDDICLNNRFEMQLNFLKNNKEISVLGGVIEEFSNEKETKNLVKRKLPEKDVDIKTYMKYRCPFNQMSVILKKNDAIEAGGYKDWFCNEDYYLWIRMALKGYKFHNLQQVLLKVRTNKNFYNRRSGLKYFKSEAKIQKLMLKNKIITLPTFVFNVSIRFIIQVLFNESLRKYFFNTFARSK